MSIATNVPLPTLLLTAAAALAVSGCAVSFDLDGGATERTETDRLPAAGLTELSIVTENGAVDVVGGDVDEIEVRTGLRESDEGDARRTIDVIEDRLELVGECDDGWWDECRVGFSVTIPRDLDVTVRTDNGRIDVAGVVGDVDVASDNGAIEAAGIGSDRVAARTDNGRIELRFDIAPESVDAESDNGAIAVRVPDDGEPYDVDARSDNGSIDVDVRTDPAADRSIVTASGNGSIDVEYRTPDA